MRINPLNSHLFWFVILGASIFVVDALFRDDDTRIVVDEAVIARIANLWQTQMQRDPTSAELDSLLNDWLDEEMLYREAKRLGLEEDDVIIRRRLVQKLYFIAEESTIDEPAETQLRQWFESHEVRFRLPERLSFSQVFFGTREAAQSNAAVIVDAAGDWRALSEPSMISPAYRLRNAREIQTVFGRAFVESITGLAADGTWHGPIESEFGWHLVRLDERHPAEVPGFENVRADVLNDYVFSARSRAREALLDELRERYDVAFEL